MSNLQDSTLGSITEEELTDEPSNVPDTSTRSESGIDFSTSDQLAVSLKFVELQNLVFSPDSAAATAIHKLQLDETVMTSTPVSIGKVSTKRKIPYECSSTEESTESGGESSEKEGLDDVKLPTDNVTNKIVVEPQAHKEVQREINEVITPDAMTVPPTTPIDGAEALKHWRCDAKEAVKKLQELAEGGKEVEGEDTKNTNDVIESEWEVKLEATEDGTNGAVTVESEKEVILEDVEIKGQSDEADKTCQDMVEFIKVAAIETVEKAHVKSEKTGQSEDDGADKKFQEPTEGIGEVKPEPTEDDTHAAVKKLQELTLSILELKHESTEQERPIVVPTPDIDEPDNTSEDGAVASTPIEPAEMAMSDPPTRPLTLKGRVSGIVKWFDPKNGFGYITVDNSGEEIFVHMRDIRRKNPQHSVPSLSEGERVEFSVKMYATQVTGLCEQAVLGSPLVAMYPYHFKMVPRWPDEPQGSGWDARRSRGGGRGGSHAHRQSHTMPPQTNPHRTQLPQPPLADQRPQTSSGRPIRGRRYGRKWNRNRQDVLGSFDERIPPAEPGNRN